MLNCINSFYHLYSLVGVWRVGPNAPHGRLATDSSGGLGDGPDDSSLQWFYNRYTADGSYSWVSTDCVDVTYVGDRVRDRQQASYKFSNPGSTDNKETTDSYHYLL